MLLINTSAGVACDTLGNLLQEEGNADQFLRLQGNYVVANVLLIVANVSSYPTGNLSEGCECVANVLLTVVCF